jgi:small subunit ribosomal protein S17
MPRKKQDESTATENAETSAEEPSMLDTVLETAEETLVSVAKTVGRAAADVVSAVTTPVAPKAKQHKRAEKVGIVASDKMMKTVTVRVDRLVKHPVYRKYVKKRKKFMAHDEMGARVGDKVKIVETRPMSARKRWRVVEIIQKAEL